MKISFLRKLLAILCFTVGVLDIFASNAFAEPMSLAMATLYGLLGGGAIAGGMSLLGGGGDGGDLEYQQLPEYPEAEAGRGEWWNRLQDWGEKPGYGAISPNWEDIWQRAKGKVSRYYWGGPGETGQAGKVRASAARRGVSQSPAMEAELTKMGQQESIQLGDLATEQASQEASFGEQGRMNWLTSLQNLSGLKPQFVTSTGVTQPSEMMPLLSELGGAAGKIYGQQKQQNWLEDLMKQYGTQQPKTTQSSIMDYQLPNMPLSGSQGGLYGGNSFSSFG